MLRRIAYHVFIDSAIHLLGGEKRDMTKLVINEHTPDQMPDEVVAGQLRCDKEGQLILVTGRLSDKSFNGIFLKHFDEDVIFNQVRSENVNGEYLIRYYPHVVDNAVITVDINKEV